MTSAWCKTGQESPKHRRESASNLNSNGLHPTSGLQPLTNERTNRVHERVSRLADGVVPFQLALQICQDFKEFRRSYITDVEFTKGDRHL